MPMQYRFSPPRGPRLAAASLFAVALGLVSASACNNANVSGNTNVACQAPAAPTTPRPSAWHGTVFTLVMENHSYGDVVGNPAAPYINGLIAQGALAAGYHDSYVHPSEPNYIWMVAGENFGILNDDDPGPGNVIDTTAHLVDQLEQAGLTWKAYQEDMTTPCGLVSGGRYASKHNPFVYFADVNGWDGKAMHPGERCTSHVVDYGQLPADLQAGQVPDYAFITPNLQHDMHDGSVAQGDAWLAAEVPRILASPAYTNGGALFILWDEGSNDGDNPPFFVMSPNAKAGFVSQQPYDTSSFLKTVQSMMGVAPLPCAADPAAVPAMDDLFTVPLSAAAP